MAFFAPIPSRQETPSFGTMPSSPGPSNPLESLRALAQGSPVEQAAGWLRGLMDSAINAPGASGLMGGPWGAIGGFIPKNAGAGRAMLGQVEGKLQRQFDEYGGNPPWSQVEVTTPSVRQGAYVNEGPVTAPPTSDYSGQHSFSRAMQDTRHSLGPAAPGITMKPRMPPPIRMAPVTNARPWPGTDYVIYELTEDIKDASGKVLHPKNSTMTNHTLKGYGYTLPE